MHETNIEKMIGLSILESLLEEKCTPERAKLIRAEIKGLGGREQLAACARYILDLQRDDMPELVVDELEKTLNEFDRRRGIKEELEQLREKSANKTLTDQDRERLVRIAQETLNDASSLTKDNLNDYVRDRIKKENRTISVMRTKAA